MNTSEPFEPKDEDIFWLTDHNAVAPYPISPFKDLRNTVLKRVDDKRDPIMRDGVKCQYLSPTEGGGWKSGKIRVKVAVSFEFIPDPTNSM